MSEESLSGASREVVVTDIKMPFWSMVMLLVKLAIAAIPALIILFIIGGLLSAGVAMLLGGGWHHWEWGSGRML